MLPRNTKKRKRPTDVFLSHLGEHRVAELRQFAKELGLAKTFWKLRKDALIRELQRAYAGLRIYIAWKARKTHAIGKGKKGRKRTRKESSESIELDPLTLSPPRSPIFYFSPSKTHYGAKVLIEYLHTSKDLRDPMSRLPLEKRHLDILDTLSLAMGHQHVSQYQDGQGKEQRLAHDNLVCALENEASDWVLEMVAVTERYEANTGIALLVQQIFPSFLVPFRELYNFDKHASRQAIDHYRALLKGPPNRPVVGDPFISQHLDFFFDKLMINYDE